MNSPCQNVDHWLILEFCLNNLMNILSLLWLFVDHLHIRALPSASLEHYNCSSLLKSLTFRARRLILESKFNSNYHIWTNFRVLNFSSIHCYQLNLRDIVVKFILVQQRTHHFMQGRTSGERKELNQAVPLKTMGLKKN